MRWLIGWLLIAALWSCKSNPASSTDGGDDDVIVEEVSIPTRYGFDVDSFLFFDASIGRNDFLSTILNRYGIDAGTIHRISEAAQGIFDVRKLQSGKPYCVLTGPDSVAQCFIYEPNALEYVIYDFRNRDSIQVTIEQRPVTYKEKTASGVITSSLYKSIEDAGANPVLALTMSDVYAWTIDFYRIQKNDKFKVVYDEKWVDDQPVGIGAIKAVWFEHFGSPYYAYWFEGGEQADYFDDEANSLRKAFLKAPVKFSNITSRYSRNRLHPVLRTNRPHLGTDYAAPHGTEIMSTGDGVVIEAGYTSGNGNYVKIRHNGTYSTQYLHMSRFARGIGKGVRVRQGQVIGYVGSTGLATGPHVCYRFWKNGSQVDPLREKIPPSEPVKAEYRADFDSIKVEWKARLDEIPLRD